MSGVVVFLCEVRSLTIVPFCNDSSYHQITKAQARDEHTNIGMVSSSTSGGKGRNNDDLKELNGLCDGVKKLFSKVKGDVIK